jgi:Ser/Thr protein kinase RdoA (MazF antagonist)
MHNFVIAQFDLPTLTHIESLGSAGGFSGARLWKLHSTTGAFCLRRWPTTHPDASQLQSIHRVLVHARHNGCPFVAAPIVNRRDERVTRHDGALWEISNWMPGSADFHADPNDLRLKNMLQSLATFHLTSAQVNLDFGQSANLQSRIKQLQTLPGTLEKLAGVGDLPVELRRLNQLVWANGMAVAQPLLQNLMRFANVHFAVQPIIRDVWHDHVLFVENSVSGLVDFGAMQMDNIAFDLARLLGSTIGDQAERWPLALETYSQIRPLSQSERELIPLLDQTGVLLGSVNWLSWICVERRQFENWELVKKRIDYLEGRFFGLQ